MSELLASSGADGIPTATIEIVISWIFGVHVQIPFVELDFFRSHFFFHLAVFNLHGLPIVSLARSLFVIVFISEQLVAE